MRMRTAYSVVRYMVDEASGEFVNIGVIAADEERTSCKFLDKFGRAAQFGGISARVLQRHVARFEESFGSLFEEYSTVGRGVEGLYDAHREWQNVIRLSEPVETPRPLQRALDMAAKRFLTMRGIPLHSDRADVTRTTAINQGVQALRNACRIMGATEENVVERSDAGISAGNESDPIFLYLDYAYRVDRIELGGYGLSIYTADEDDILKVFGEATGIKKVPQYAGLPICLNLVGSADAGQKYDKILRLARQLFGDIGPVLDEDSLQRWTADNLSVAVAN